MQTKTFIPFLAAIQILLAGATAASAQSTDAPLPASSAPAAVQASGAAPAEQHHAGFLDFNYLYDTRDMNVFNLNALGNLPHGFQYFAMMNFSAKTKSNRNAEVESFYTEQNLRWTPVESIPVALTTQWQIANGPANDSLRFGFLWSISRTPRLKPAFDRLNLSLFVNVHPFQLDSHSDYQWQMEYVYKWKVLPEILDNRISLSGFADQKMEGGQVVWVTEHQAALRLVYGLHATTRFRHNGHLPMDQTGFGLGLQYVVEL